MKLEKSVRYDAPVADVYAMLTDPAFREKAAFAQGATTVDVRVEGTSVTIDMTQQLTDIPSFAKPIAGERTRAIQTESWHDGDRAEFAVSSPALPVGIEGTRRLRQDGDGTLDSFEGEARARLPLVGKRIEALIVERLKDGWDTESAVGRAWLAGER